MEELQVGTIKTQYLFANSVRFENTETVISVIHQSITKWMSTSSTTT